MVASRTDGNFKFFLPEKPFDFTGERMTSDISGQIALEHFHRYCIARDLCAGKDVLDVASGEGYGSALLSGVAQSVIGIEIDSLAVEHARANYVANNLRYLEGRAQSLPLDDASVDVVVSFETLEHVREHEDFISEVRRVLRPGGLFIVSSPDRIVYSARAAHVNEYHLRELSATEFQHFLGSHFKNTSYLSQRAIVCSLAAALDGAGWRSYEERAAFFVEASDGLARTPYIIGIASDAVLPEIVSSAYIHRLGVDDILEGTHRVPALQRELEQARKDHEGALDQLRSAQAEAVKQADAARRERDLVREICAIQLAQEVARLEAVKIDAATQFSIRLSQEAARLEAVKIDAAAQFSIYLTERQEYLRQLDKTERRPWRPATHFFQYVSLVVLAGLALPLSSRTSQRMMRSAAKRSPWRYKKAYLDAKLALANYERTSALEPIVTAEAASARHVTNLVIAQPLRDHLLERYDETVIPLYSHLISVVLKYANDSVAFDRSEQCTDLVARAKTLASARASACPVVSIIIPAYNNLLYTLTSTVSILEAETRVAYEIIIADDCSSDATAEIIGAVGGAVRHYRPEKNLGFLRNCNEATKQARGAYVLLLNNDTLVLPGWLDALVEVFSLHDKVGMVGSKLLNGDGTLQEAGGIFWKDGSAWNFGRNQNPLHPQFNYLKDVDYVSGAAIMLPKSLWDSLGGFDEHFLPAYCEDSDLAFRVRAAGYRMIYQPRSEVIHHEGRSHGTDVGTGIKAYQVVNQKKLVERWRDVLEKEHFANGENVVFARDRSRGKPRILIVDHYIPQWDRDAGSRTIYKYVRLFLDSGFHVIFWPDNLYRDPEYTPKLQDLGVEVIYNGQNVGSFDKWILENGANLNYILFSRPDVTIKYINITLAFPHIKRIYYGHDLHCMRLRQNYTINPKPDLLAEADRVEAVERSVCGLSDVVLYPSQDEIDIVASWNLTAASRAVPMLLFDRQEVDAGHRHAQTAHERDFRHLLFVGGFSHSPNLDGVQWFLSEVMPLLIAVDAGFVLSIAGSNIPKIIEDQASANVHILGRVSDEQLADLYSQSGISIAPLRFGAGVKGKVIEAMAKGVPVVTTNVGAQGIPDAGRYVSLAETGTDFAAAILAYLENRDSAREKAMAAVDFIESDYSVFTARKILSHFVPEITNIAGV